MPLSSSPPRGPGGRGIPGAPADGRDSVQPELCDPRRQACSAHPVDQGWSGRGGSLPDHGDSHTEDEICVYSFLSPKPTCLFTGLQSAALQSHIRELQFACCTVNTLHSDVPASGRQEQYLSSKAFGCSQAGSDLLTRV